MVKNGFRRQAVFPCFRNGAITHRTANNNNGRQETLTGSCTTHDTNKTIFQDLSAEEKQNLPVIGEQNGPHLLKDEPNIWSTWSLCGVLNDENLPLLGSWTFFKKLVSNVEYEAVAQQYLSIYVTVLYGKNI